MTNSILTRAAQIGPADAEAAATEQLPQAEAAPGVALAAAPDVDSDIAPDIAPDADFDAPQAPMTSSLIAFHDPTRLAKVERAFLTCKELFKEWPKGHKGGFRFRREIEYTVKKKENGKTVAEKETRVLEVRSDAPIGAFHLLLLEAIISMAYHCLSRKASAWQNPEGQGPVGTALRARLDLEHDATLSPFLFLRCSYYELAIQMGRKPETALRRQIDEALVDLQGIRFVWRKKNGRILEASNLISHLRFPGENERKPIAVGLSPSLSQAIISQKPYACISMPEARKLASAPAVILLGWLSSLINPGRTKDLFVETVIDAIWIPTDNPATLRSRKKELMDRVLPDLVGAGWKCARLESGKLRFTRPKLKEDAILTEIKPVLDNI